MLVKSNSNGIAHITQKTSVVSFFLPFSYELSGKKRKEKRRIEKRNETKLL